MSTIDRSNTSRKLAPGARSYAHRLTRHLPSSRRPAIERRPYPELNETERAIVKVALPSESVSRDDVLEMLDDAYEEEEVLDAFSTLVDEHRLYRIGNRADYMMVERDLF